MIVTITHSGYIKRTNSAEYRVQARGGKGVKAATTKAVSYTHLDVYRRQTLVGVNPAYVNEDLPYFHMWMEGTGSYAKLDTRCV